MLSLWELWVWDDTECPSLAEATPGYSELPILWSAPTTLILTQ